MKRTPTRAELDRLEALEPAFGEAVRLLIVDLDAWCAARPYGVRLISGYRSLDEQARLYAQGRTAPGKIVTNAKPGTSAHNFRLGADLAFLADASPHAYAPNDDPAWLELGTLADAHGLGWGGKWRIRDLGHVEAKGWRSQFGGAA